MPNAPRSARPAVASLGPPIAVGPGTSAAAALGRFYYPEPPLWPAALSVAVHVAVVAALVWTVGDVLARPVTPEESVFFIPPPQQPKPTATSGGDARAHSKLSLAYLSGYGPGDAASGSARKSIGRGGQPHSGLHDSVAHASVDTLSAGDNVYTSFQVDNVVELSSGSAVPEYPPDLLARGVQGQVTVRFIVDTSGNADVESIEVLHASDPQFAASVRAALSHMRFSPARLNGHRVRQLVEQPFRFNVEKPASNPTDSAAIKP